MSRLLGTLAIAALLLVCIAAILWVTSPSNPPTGRTTPETPKTAVAPTPASVASTREPDAGAKLGPEPLPATDRPTTAPVATGVPSVPKPGPVAKPPFAGPKETKTALDALKEAMASGNTKLVEQLLKQLVKDTAAAPHLLELLAEKTYSPDARTRLLRAIVKAAPPGAFDEIVRLLQVEDQVAFQQQLIQAAVTLGGDRAVLPLLELVKRSASEEVRKAAAQALARAGDPRAIESLVELAKSETDAATRKLILAALGTAKSTKAVSILTDLLKRAAPEDDDTRIGAAEALADMGTPEALDALLSVIRDAPNSKEAESAIDALSSIADVNQAAVYELGTKLMESPSDELKEKAAEILGYSGDKRALKPLLEMLKTNPNPDLRSAAAEALGNFESPDLTGSLVEILATEQDPAVRGYIAESIGYIGDEAAVSHLIKALQSEPNLDTKTLMVQALGDIGSAAAIPALVELFKSDQPKEIKLAAIDSLGYIGEAAATPAIIDGIRKSDDPEITTNLIQALGQIKDPSALPVLEGILSNPTESADLKRAAAFSIAQISEEDALPILNKAFQSAQDDVTKLAVVDGLTMIAETPAVKEFARTELSSTLTQLALESKDRNVRLRSVQALATFVGKDAIATIQQVAEKDPDASVRSKAYQLYVKLKAGK